MINKMFKHSVMSNARATDDVYFTSLVYVITNTKQHAKYRKTTVDAEIKVSPPFLFYLEKLCLCQRLSK